MLLNRNHDGADLHFAEVGGEVFLAGLEGHDWLGDSIAPVALVNVLPMESNGP